MNLNITLEQPDKKLALFGSADRHLRMIRDAFGVTLVSRDDELRLAGEKEQVGKAALVLDQMQKKLRRQDWLSVEDVGAAIGHARDELRERAADEIEMESSYLVINTSQAGESSVYQTGRYLDHVVRTADGWRFKRKRVVYDTSRIQTLLAIPI